MWRTLPCLFPIFLAGQPAAASGGCDLRPDIVADLGTRLGQTRRGLGVTQEHTVLELFAAEDGGWTLIATTPSGIACPVASGRDWREAAIALPARG
ncbi:hypothetical protein L0V05_10255 [Tabrizicola sp. J26]|uniref:hypothetical protein n=1 Tax=Alitabrizicola rongguiensis TaxID=2909234 RepID=UPI001F3025E6|nr:hypothetical protein [Tabrizicola rongguiensis]MCF1709199.1 hypothetical protein [Tabrizicola rongguiensis]